MSKIKINKINESQVEVFFELDVPVEMVNQLVKSFNDKGLYEDLQKSTLSQRFFSTRGSKADQMADDLIKSLENMAKGKPPYPFSSWDEHTAWKRKNRVMDWQKESRSKGVPTTPKPNVAPTTPNTVSGTPNKLFDPERSGTVDYRKDPTKKSEDCPPNCECESCSMEKSGYGPKKGGQYTVADNVKRKANNVGDVAGQGPNVNVKSYSTKPGQLSAKAQASDTAKKQAALNRKQPVKVFSQEEKDELARQMGLKKSWANHLPFPNAEEEMAKIAAAQRAQRGEDAMANQLANMMSSKAMLGQGHRQPSSEDMIMAGESMGLGTSEEMVKKADQQWNGTINNWLAEATKPISQRFASEEEELAYWNSIKVGDRDDGQSGY